MNPNPCPILPALCRVAMFKEGVQEKNSHNRPDIANAVNSAEDGKAVEYYFASDAR